MYGTRSESAESVTSRTQCKDKANVIVMGLDDARKRKRKKKRKTQTSFC